jgi:hypothetical protein
MFLMFVLTITDGLCCSWFIYPTLCWCCCLEIGTSSIDWAQMRRFSPEDTNRIQSPKSCVLNIKQDTG